MLSGYEPVNCRVHETKHSGSTVEEVEVELFSLTGHISRQGHGLDDATFDSAFHIVGLGIVQVGIGPGLHQLAPRLPLVQGKRKSAHECDEMVQKNHGGADHGKIKQVAHATPFCFFRHLVVASHERGGHNVPENGTAEENQDFLVNPVPCGVTRSKKNGLQS